MMFETNDGQTDQQVKFLARAPGYTLFLTEKEAVLSIPIKSPVGSSAPAGRQTRIPSLSHIEVPTPARVVRLRFAGGIMPTAITGRDQLPGKSNYFIGDDPKQWHRGVSNYAGVEYRGIYPGVDAVFRGDNRRLEFDFEVAPGADPGKIALEVQGARRMRVNSAGDVVLRTDGKRDLLLGKPHIYQQSPEGRREIAGHYVLITRNRIAFALGSYDHFQQLVIDPTLTYSTYLGGSLEDLPYGIAADSSGSAYVTGETFSANFPVTSGAYQTSCTLNCIPGMAFVAKFSPDGTSLVYSTFLSGTTGGDVGTGIGVDSSGNAYILGAEQGELDFPTTAGAIQASCSIPANLMPEVFVAKLDSKGSNLVYSTCLQNPAVNASNLFSQGSTFPGGIAVDGDGNAYVTGSTDLPQDFPTTQNSFQTTCQPNGPEGCSVSEDPFVVKIAPSGTLLYSTFLSGGAIGSLVISTGIAVDSKGNAYVIGDDNDPPGFPGGLLTTVGSLVSSCPSGGCVGFLAKINGTATALAYSTYLANVTEYVTPTAVAVDQDGNAYVSGYTGSTDFPSTLGVLQYSFTPPGAATANQEDGFVIKMNQLGDGYAYATLLGGTAYDTVAVGIAVDAAGHAFVTGTTGAGYPTTPDAFQTTDQEAANQQFFSELDPIGASLLYSTFLAGTTGGVFDTQPSTSGVSYLATDPSGNAYFTGQTNSTDFPTTAGAFQTNSPSAGGSGTATGFVAKFAFAAATPLSISPIALPDGMAGVPYSPVAFTTMGGQGTAAISETGGLPAGMSFSNAQLSGTPTQTGSYPITIAATDSQNDMASEPLTLVIDCPSIVVTPTSLAPGTSGTAYGSVTFMQTGGVGAAVFAESGALPTGITFVAGVLGGTPTQTGSFPFTVTATDTNACIGTTSPSPTLTISPSTGPPPPPAVVMDSETITVSDTETFPDVADSEPITVSDAVTVTPLISFSGPAASFSTGALGFNGASGAQSLTVSNVGEGSLVFGGTPAISSNSGSFTVTQTVCSNGATSLPKTLPSGGACTLTISYMPSGTPLADTGTIVFSDNAALSSPASSGTGPAYLQTISLNGGGSGTGPLLPPSATVTIPAISETITVTDTEAFPDVADSEAITVTDQVKVTVQGTPVGPTVSFTGAPSVAAFNSTFVVSATTNASTMPAISVGGTPGVCSVGSVTGSPSKSSATVTMTSGTGTCSVMAVWGADSNYTGATATQSTRANMIAPSVSFTGAPASAANGFTFTVNATTNASVLPVIRGSGACLAGPVSGTPASATAPINMTAASGTCTLSAVWPADNNFTGATLMQSTTSIAVNTISPTGGEQGQTLNVTMTGQGFVNGVTTANFGPNITVNYVTVTDSDDITANITIAPGAPVGLIRVRVATRTYAVDYNFGVTTVVLSLSPTSGRQGQTLNVAIAGEGFVNGVTTANFGPNITVNYVTVTDSDDATANITIAPGAPRGVVSVRVTTGTSVLRYQFGVTTVVFSLSPTSGKQGQTLNVAIAGEGFVNGVTTANFGPNITVNYVTVTDSDDATANITIAPGAPLGRVSVRVTTGTTVDGFNFFITGVVLSLSPTGGRQGQTLNVAITGEGFVNGVTTANFGPNITVNYVTVTDSDDATANITIAPGAPRGVVSVRVTTGTSVLRYQFGVTTVVFSLSPTSGKQGQTLNVAIAGEGFVNGVTTANFGPNITVNYVTVTDSDDATANITIAPTAPASVFPLTVTVTTGTSVLRYHFGVTTVVFSLSPTSGVLGQTLNVAITGEGFVNGVTTANFGRLITVHSVTVTDSEDATANITIAPPQPGIGSSLTVTVTVTTGAAPREIFRFSITR